MTIIYNFLTPPYTIFISFEKEPKNWILIRGKYEYKKSTSANNLNYGNH